ncbi:MAG: hypothetical protein EZS28_028475, partial [Streblomastix strix]
KELQKALDDSRRDCELIRAEFDDANNKGQAERSSRLQKILKENADLILREQQHHQEMDELKAQQDVDKNRIAELEQENQKLIQENVALQNRISRFSGFEDEADTDMLREALGLIKHIKAMNNSDEEKQKNRGLVTIGALYDAWDRAWQLQKEKDRLEEQLEDRRRTIDQMRQDIAKLQTHDFEKEKEREMEQLRQELEFCARRIKNHALFEIATRKEENVLKEQENILLIYIDQAQLQSLAQQSTSQLLQTFMLLDFLDFPSVSTPHVAGPQPKYKLVSRFKVRATPFLLHSLIYDEQCATLELYSISTGARIVARGTISLRQFMSEYADHEEDVDLFYVGRNSATNTNTNAIQSQSSQSVDNNNAPWTHGEKIGTVHVRIELLMPLWRSAGAQWDLMKTQINSCTCDKCQQRQNNRLGLSGTGNGVIKPSTIVQAKPKSSQPPLTTQPSSSPSSKPNSSSSFPSKPKPSTSQTVFSQQPNIPSPHNNNSNTENRFVLPSNQIQHNQHSPSPSLDDQHSNRPHFLDQSASGNKQPYTQSQPQTQSSVPPPKKQFVEQPSVEAEDDEDQDWSDEFADGKPF